jgi:hypothetical protein
MLHNMESKMIFKSFIIAFSLLITLPSCEKRGGITYPEIANNYGENIFVLPSGLEGTPTKLLKGESYSLEANLSKKSFLRVVFTNTTPEDPTTYYRWLFTYQKGWYADNFVNKKQEFTTNTVGNNDLKIVFQGDSGQCRVDVYDNGGEDPIDVKFFAW